MKELPILMNERSVKAILAGTQTQDRRPVRPQLLGQMTGAVPWADGLWRIEHGPMDAAIGQYVGLRVRCPYGRVGDRLWVRETHAYPVTVLGAPNYLRMTDGEPVIFRTDVQSPPGGYTKWRPSIHMPRWACRILLDVKRVWVERVQDITEADAKAEGVCKPICDCGECEDNTYRGMYHNLMIDIYGHDLWDNNHWMFACEFEVRKTDDD